jgi:hypothetical protein
MFLNIPCSPITHQTTYGYLSQISASIINVYIRTLSKTLGYKLIKLHFHTHRPHFLPDCKDAGLNTNFNLFLIYLDSLLIMHLTLIRHKLEYASIVWNSVVYTDARKLEHIQKFIVLCQNHFFNHDHVTYMIFLKFLNLHSLHNISFNLDALFFISSYLDLK